MHSKDKVLARYIKVNIHTSDWLTWRDCRITMGFIADGSKIDISFNSLQKIIKDTRQSLSEALACANSANLSFFK